MLTSEVLNKAADLIEERGWKSGGGWQYADQLYDDMPMCLEGGIQAATGLHFASIACDVTAAELTALRTCPAYRAVVEYLDADLPLFNWNDESERTAEQVIEVLRATALIEAAKENAETREQVSA